MDGKLIFAFSASFGIATGIQAEARALYLGSSNVFKEVSCYFRLRRILFYWYIFFNKNVTFPGPCVMKLRCSVNARICSHPLLVAFKKLIALHITCQMLGARNQLSPSTQLDKAFQGWLEEKFEQIGQAYLLLETAIRFLFRNFIRLCKLRE